MSNIPGALDHRAEMLAAMEKARHRVSYLTQVKFKLQPVEVTPEETTFDNRLHTSSRGTEILADRKESHGKIAKARRPGFVSLEDGCPRRQLSPPRS